MHREICALRNEAMMLLRSEASKPRRLEFLTVAVKFMEANRP